MLTGQTFQAYYQREEIAIALNMSRVNPSSHKLVPGFIHGIPTIMEEHQIPFGLHLKQAIDLPKIGGMLSLVFTLKKLISRDQPLNHSFNRKLKEESVTSEKTLRRDYVRSTDTFFESLGYEARMTRSDDLTEWKLCAADNNSLVLKLVFYPDHLVVVWPTTFHLFEGLECLVNEVRRGRIKGDEVSITAIDRKGKQYRNIVSVDDLIGGECPQQDLALFRVDLPAFAFVAEIFSPDQSYVLKSGLILKEPDIGIIWAFHSKLGTHYLPKEMYHAIGSIISNMR